jgi:acetyl-CoA carboxylase carboxyltransferase component
MFAKLSGKVPLVGIVSGRCFAGNAVLLGCCDVIIAAQNANIGMAGPVMIEGGGLGVFKPEDIGPMNVQTNNGVVDIAVADDAEAVAVARKYLSVPARPSFFGREPRSRNACPGLSLTLGLKGPTGAGYGGAGRASNKGARSVWEWRVWR